MKGLPRQVEGVLAIAGLTLASPVMALVAMLIKATSTGPVFFQQRRVGLDGRSFRLYKFRSMHVANTGIRVTASGDPRVTPIGRIIRKAKIDELPELWNVVRGDISLVGPRPEVPRYVDMKNPLWQKVLEVRPGITDPVTLRLRNEEHLLSSCGTNTESFYLDSLQRYKLLGYIDYLKNRSWKSDVRVLFESLIAILMPSKCPAPSLEEMMGVRGSEAGKRGG